MSISSPRGVVGFVLALCSMAAAVLFASAAPALAETCPNEEFRTGVSAPLPDCRAYEMVTPPFKEGSKTGIRGATPTGQSGLGGVSASGSRVDVISIGNFGDVLNGVLWNNYQLTRTESGWSESSLDLPESQIAEEEDVSTTPEMEATLYVARAVGQSLKAKDFWLREADGALRDVGPFEPPADTEGPSGPGGYGAVATFRGGSFLEASRDLSHILFKVDGSVSWPGDEAYGAAGGTLYEYVVGEGGPPIPVGVEPEGAPCAPSLPNGHVEGGISADGSTVVFACGGQIFARIDNGEAGARTVAISEPSAADCSACDTSAGVRAEAQFVGLSADGSKVFFTTTQPLLGGDSSRNIYEYDFDAPQASAGDPDGRLVRVSSGGWGAGGAQVQGVRSSNSSQKDVSLGVQAISEDGSHVYFTAAGALSGAVNSQGKAPVEGGENFYVSERDAQFPGGRLSFIATGSGEESNASKESKPETTPDGQFFVFANSGDITPGDTGTARQIFEYDAQTGELVRCSIGEEGFNDNGNTNSAALYAYLPYEVSLPTPNMPQAVKPRALSDNGAYVVFQSADGLTPGSLGGAAYEYHAGNVYPISGPGGGSLEGMSPSGADIFFSTTEQLLPQDTDTNPDLYDAHIDGGFTAPVSLLPSCQGDACQGPLTGAPVLLSPGSEFQAGGNPPLSESALGTKPKPKPKAKRAGGCRKGYMERSGRCVRRPVAKRGRAKKASNDRRGGR